MTWKIMHSEPKRMIDHARGLSVTSRSNKYGFDFQISRDEIAIIAFMAYIDKIDDSQAPPAPISFTWAIGWEGGGDLPMSERRDLIEDALGAWKMFHGEAFDRKGRLREALVSVAYGGRIEEM